MTKKTKKQPSTERPLYSQAWLARYGKTLEREEIQLVQGFRGLDATQREGLLKIVASLVMIENAQGGAR